MYFTINAYIFVRDIGCQSEWFSCKSAELPTKVSIDFFQPDDSSLFVMFKLRQQQKWLTSNDVKRQNCTKNRNWNRVQCPSQTITGKKLNKMLFPVIKRWQTYYKQHTGLIDRHLKISP